MCNYNNYTQVKYTLICKLKKKTNPDFLLIYFFEFLKIKKEFSDVNISLKCT